MRAEILEYKKRILKQKDIYAAYWTFPLPVTRTVGIGSYLWVAQGGRWRGHFTITETDGYDDDRIYEVDFDHWVSDDRGPRRPFQGFTLKVPPRRSRR
ncbi:MAG: hypothetical protein KGJ23_08470 [Euryarchaeota archaeon]|nr:hypothetical protein [Euryarchaeota archaeon]MDE1879169.1 hypothetical protein [Euryarchaeota archaeon]MDE2044606.1 hypothetical protein [Thermoplasmata archaeon]